MSTSNDLLTQVLDLPREERARLARGPLASLDAPLDDPAEVEAAWLDEVRRRMRDVSEGTAELVDWDTVRAEALARMRRP